MMEGSPYVFYQSTLVLEGITLAQLVELMVEVLVNLASSTVLDKKTSKNTQASHPEDLAVCPHLLVKCPSVTATFIESVVIPSYLGILASAVPFLLPKPRCLPILRAAFSSLARARECMATGLRMMRPSETNFRIVCREFAFEISLTSLGSSQILRFPQPTTDAARRFWVRRFVLKGEMHQLQIFNTVVIDHAAKAQSGTAIGTGWKSEVR